MHGFESKKVTVYQPFTMSPHDEPWDLAAEHRKWEDTCRGWKVAEYNGGSRGRSMLLSCPGVSG